MGRIQHIVAQNDGRLTPTKILAKIRKQNIKIIIHYTNRFVLIMRLRPSSGVLVYYWNVYLYVHSKRKHFHWNPWKRSERPLIIVFPVFWYTIYDSYTYIILYRMINDIYYIVLRILIAIIFDLTSFFLFFYNNITFTGFRPIITIAINV